MSFIRGSKCSPKQGGGWASALTRTKSVDMDRYKDRLGDFYCRNGIHLGRLYVYTDILYFESNLGTSKFALDLVKLISIDERGRSTVEFEYTNEHKDSKRKRVSVHQKERRFVIHFLHLVKEAVLTEEGLPEFDEIKRTFYEWREENRSVTAGDSASNKSAAEDDPNADTGSKEAEDYDAETIEKGEILMPYALGGEEPGLDLWKDCPYVDGPLVERKMESLSIHQFWCKILSDASYVFTRALDKSGARVSHFTQWSHVYMVAQGSSLMRAEDPKDRDAVSILTREVSFQKSMSTPRTRGTHWALCEQTHYAYFTTDAEGCLNLIFSTETKYSGFPNCDSYTVKARWVVKQAGELGKAKHSVSFYSWLFWSRKLSQSEDVEKLRVGEAKDFFEMCWENTEKILFAAKDKS